jgi:hypothetical protein
MAFYIDVMNEGFSGRQKRKEMNPREPMIYFVEGLTIAGEISNKVRRIGEYCSLGDALAGAERAISEFLVREVRPGMLPGALFTRYKSFGEVPYIFRDDGDITVNLPGFNHFQYALARCAEICRLQGFENR